jgi:hypothetical protein
MLGVNAWESVTNTEHAQKEARARAAKSIGKELAYFFSCDYLSANDLSTALGRLIPAVVRGDIKPKTALTVAYLAQTLLQSIRLAQHEYIEAFSGNRWRNAIANSVNENLDYRLPPKPAPPSPVVAGLQTGAVHAPQSAAPPITAPQQTPSNLMPPPTVVIPNPVAPFANGGEGSASSSSSAPSPTPSPAPESPVSAPDKPPSAPPAAPPSNPSPTAPAPPKPVQPWPGRALHFGPEYRLFVNGDLRSANPRTTNPSKIDTYRPSRIC